MSADRMGVGEHEESSASVHRFRAEGFGLTELRR